MSRRAALLLLALTLVVGVFLVYAPVAGHDWIAYDDDVYLLENPHVARGLDWAEIRWVATHELAANYHPLTWVSHMLDVELFGLEPAGHHLMNVALHALVSVLVLALFAALLGNPWAAGLGAALFALHPLRVESVAWAAERKDLLCALFFVAGLLAWLGHARRPSLARYLGVCVWLVLALVSKPMAVSFPAVVLLLGLLSVGDEPVDAERNARARRLRLEILPLAALAALGALATLWAQARAGATSSLGGLAPELRVLNALATLATYVGQSLWPRALSVYYPHAAHASEAPLRALAPQAAVGALLLAGALVLAWRLRRAAPVVTLGLGFFLVTLVPVIGLVQVGTQAHADRYTYLPSLGLVVALVALALHLAPRRARLLAGLGTTLALLGALQTRQQVGYWRDTRTLFEHALALDPRNFLAHSKLGELALAEGDLPAAQAAFERTLELNPDHVETLNNLGLCRLASGALEEAAAPLERALLLAPEDAETWLNLGTVELERGQFPAARRRFERARELAPGSPDGAYNLGCLAQRERRFDLAEGHFLEALALAPEHVDAWSNLGQARLASGKVAEARAAFERAAELAPEDALAHFNLGVARRRDGDRAGAAQAFRRALALEPDFGPADEALRALEVAPR